jgi:hypothetical protein
MLVPDPRPGSIIGRELFVEATESARGVEGALRRVQGRWTTQLGVQYGVSTIRAAGQEYAASEDRRQAFDMTVLSRVGHGWRIGAAVTANSGAPFTRVHEGVPVFDQSTLTSRWDPAPVTEAPNAVRLPAYSGLDVLAEWSGNWKYGMRVSFQAQIHDLYSSGATAGYSGYSPCIYGTPSDNCERRDYYAPDLGMQPFLGVRIAF